MTIQHIPTKLFESEVNREQLSFISQKYDFSEKQAYAIQKELIFLKCKKYKSDMKGYKISMTSKETQAIAKTNEPAYGTFLDDNIRDETEIISLSDLFEPLLEPELVFMLNEDLSDNPNFEEIVNKCTIYMGIEIPDSRYVNWFPNFNLIDLICDNGFAGKLIVSDNGVDANQIDLSDIRMNLYHNNQLIAEGESKNVMNNPVYSMMWLINKLKQHGMSLKKGMAISSGTFINPLPLKKGQYKTEFSDVGVMEINVDR